MSGQHLWVDVTATIIEPELKDDGTIDVFTNEIQEQAAQESKTTGCWICSVPLTIDTINSPCYGKDPDDGD